MSGLRTASAPVAMKASTLSNRINRRRPILIDWTSARILYAVVLRMPHMVQKSATEISLGSNALLLRKARPFALKSKCFTSATSPFHVSFWSLACLDGHQRRRLFGSSQLPGECDL